MFNPASSDSKQLSEPPKDSELHHWADYVELLCMTDLDGEFSADRLATLVGFQYDTMASSPDAQDDDLHDIQAALLGATIRELNQSEDSREDDDSGDADDPGELLDSEDDERESMLDSVLGGKRVEDNPWALDDNGRRIIGRSSESTDDRERWCEDVFELLRSRGRALSEAYPFEVRADRLEISRRQLTEKMYVYVFALCCSVLSYFSSSRMQKLTSAFERLSLVLVSKYFSHPFEVDHFGTGSAGSRFTGSPYERLAALAAAIGAEVRVKPRDFNPSDSGDSGLDLVAWLPMADGQNGLPAYFIQCACGRGWAGKQAEASFTRWHGYFHMTPPPTQVLLMPYYYRNQGEEWYADPEISGMVLDRLRIVRALNDHSTSPEVRASVDLAWEFVRANV